MRKTWTLRAVLAVLAAAAILFLSGCGRADARDTVYEDMKSSFEDSGLLSSSIGIFSRT